MDSVGEREPIVARFGIDPYAPSKGKAFEEGFGLL